MLTRYLQLLFIFMWSNTVLLASIMNEHKIEERRYKLSCKQFFDLKHKEEFLKLLSYKGINEPVSLGNYKDSFLRKAVICNDSLEKISFLLHFGANLNEENNDGGTLMHVADKINMIQFLKNKGLDIDKRNNKGETPLLYKTKHFGAWEVFAKAGAKMDVCDNDGRNVLYHFVKFALNLCPQHEFSMPVEDIVQCTMYGLRELIETYHVPVSKDHHGNSLFHKIARKKLDHLPQQYAIEFTEMLCGYLNIFCDINEVNNEGKHPFEVVRKEQHPFFIIASDQNKLSAAIDKLRKTTLSYVTSPVMIYQHICQPHVCNDPCDLVKDNNDPCDLVKDNNEKSINVLQTIHMSQIGAAKRKLNKH